MWIGLGLAEYVGSEGANPRGCQQMATNTDTDTVGERWGAEGVFVRGLIGQRP